MSPSSRTYLVVGTLLWMADAASACRGCRTEPPTAAPATSTVKPDPSGRPPNIKIETSQVQMLSQRLADVYLDLERPFALNALHVVGYLLVSLAVTAARVALLAVTAFGIVATGVAALLGPVFIPFLVVPALDWLFWGWLKSLIQYAFYQVVAQAFAFVFGTVLINFLDAFPAPYTIDRILVGGFHLVFLLLAFTYGMLQVPSLTNSPFSGRSGEAALPRRLG